MNSLNPFVLATTSDIPTGPTSSADDTFPVNSCFTLSAIESINSFVLYDAKYNLFPKLSASKTLFPTTAFVRFPLIVIASIKYTIIAKIIFTNAPAATIAILLGMLAFVNEPSFSASPSMFTNPPSGINLSSYFVSFPCFFHITGPKPIANSFTLTLQSFAIRKWPVS